ncbi:MAG: hypothetical protein IJK62_02190 [Bacteroidales bacterium]|nr:hypothetical protein [Bacteroidales bacterium]
MNTLQDLDTLVRLLKEFKLPISPILEYEINQKRDALLKAVTIEETVINSEEGIVPSKPIEENVPKVKKTLKVVTGEGEDIVGEDATKIFVQAIREIGVEKVFRLKLPIDGLYLITEGRNPKYKSQQADLGNNYYLNTHSNTNTKYRQLKKIIKLLYLDWRVELIEK